VVIPTSTSTTLVTSTRTTTTSSASSSSTAEPDNCALKFLITFGDSYSQTGFDISSTKPSSSNPFGNPQLPGWTASGGLNWVGFLASQYNTSTLLAYNFAAGGATTNATIVPPWQSTVLSFIDQVAQFSGSIAKKPSYAPWGDNALFGVWMGVNDVGNTWWMSDYDEIVERIMDTYFGQLQVLYNAGARNFMLLTVPRKLPLLSAPFFSLLQVVANTTVRSHPPHPRDARRVGRDPASRGGFHRKVQRGYCYQTGSL
jgi:phospholipase/lecithinase/hemolysin